MNRILNAIKCAICNEILESTVILPCSCNICYKHVKNQTNGFIQCEKCQVEHQIRTNGFHANKALQVIIETEIANLDFGSVHKEARKSCELIENALKEFELLIKDPFFYTYERISELKNIVQLKGEELKLRIDEEMQKYIDRLEEYERQSKEYLSYNEFKVESKRLENELKVFQSNLNSWIESLNMYLRHFLSIILIQVFDDNFIIESNLMKNTGKLSKKKATKNSNP